MIILPSARGVLQPKAGGTDPSFSSVVQLAHFDGTNGSQTFTNSCPRGTTLTASGTQSALVTLSTARSIFGTASMRVGNTSGQGRALASIHADYTFGTGDFTVEMGIWPDAVGVQNFYDMRAGNGTAPALDLFTNANGSIAVFVNNVTLMTSSAGAVVAGQWNRIAYTRSGTTGRIFSGGTQVGTGTDSTNYSASAAIDLPSWTSNSACYSNCNFDELRVTKGVARYTATYTLAVAPFPNS